MIPRDILYLTEEEVMQCMTPGEAVPLAEKGIKRLLEIQKTTLAELS